jgi:hypothetical protein
MGFRGSIGSATEIDAAGAVDRIAGGSGIGLGCEAFAVGLLDAGGVLAGAIFPMGVDDMGARGGDGGPGP